MRKNSLQNVSQDAMQKFLDPTLDAICYSAVYHNISSCNAHIFMQKSLNKQKDHTNPFTFNSMQTLSSACFSSAEMSVIER